jgi:hypothetical protein
MQYLTVQSELDDWALGNYSYTQTELEEYLTTPVIKLQPTESMKTFNPIPWYTANKGSFPTLATIAYNFYAVPAMSAEAERVFSIYVFIFEILLISTAKETITDRRNRLSTDSVEIIECLNSWMNAGILSNELFSVEMEV